MGAYSHQRVKIEKWFKLLGLLEIKQKVVQLQINNKDSPSGIGFSHQKVAKRFFLISSLISVDQEKTAPTKGVAQPPEN